MLLLVPGRLRKTLINVFGCVIPIIKESSFATGLDGNTPKLDDMQSKILISSAIRLNLSSLSGESLKIFTGTSLKSGKEAIMAQKQGKILIARGIRYGYCKIPAEIEAIPAEVLNDRQKRMCGRINGFGLGGGYESGSTLAEYYEVSRWTIVQDHKQLRKLRLVVWMDVKGKPTCYWLRSNPKVQREEYLEYEDKKLKNPTYTCKVHLTGGVRSGRQGGVRSARQDYYRINKTISAASPSPAEVRAQRLKEKEERSLAKLDTEIRNEVWKRLPPLKPGDWVERKRRLDVLVKVGPEIKAWINSGLSVAEAVDRIFEQNLELMTGGKQK